MHLTTQHWLGIGGAAALLGYLLWPKKASAAPITVTPSTPKTSVAPTKTTYTPPASGSGMTEEQKYNLGLGNGTAMGNQDAAAGRPKDIARAAASFSSVSTDVTGSTSYRAGFQKGYDEGYDTLSKAMTPSVKPDSVEPDTEPTTTEVPIDTGAEVTGRSTRVGHEYTGMRGSWYGSTFLPSWMRHVR